MHDRAAPLRRSVDWAAVVGAAMVAATVTLPLFLLLLPLSAGAGDPAMVLKLIASLVLGIEILADTHFDATIAALGIMVHYGLAFFATSIIAFILHRWGLLVGIAGGALLGLVFFVINFIAVTQWLQQMHIMAHWSVALMQIAFGAIAGGVYELLETDPPGERQQPAPATLLRAGNG